MTLQNKIFRKAFYENAALFQDSLVFVELHNFLVAKKIGITADDQCVIVQNKNEFSELPNKFKIVNLDMERTDPLTYLRDTNVQALTDSYKESFSADEIQQMFFFSDDTETNLFQQFLKSLKGAILDDELIYGHTKRGLGFLRNLLQELKKDALFVTLRDSTKFEVEPKDGQTLFTARQ